MLLFRRGLTLPPGSNNPVMKRRLLILAALAVLSLWSCEKDPEVTPEPDRTPSEITLSASSFEVEAAGGNLSLVVTAPSRPKVNALPSWISLTDGTFQDYQITFGLTVSENSAYEARESALTVTAGTLSRTFTVKQAAAEKPEVVEIEVDKDLTNPQATSAARMVYAFLREQAGQKVLSGVQAGGTANNNERVDAVHAITGKHPALAGYDYIFLQYSPTPAGWSWKVDYGDISAPREQWKKNGLVSFMWHWNVPTDEAAWKKGMEGDFEGYQFYSDKTRFDINRALVAGNWENDFLLSDIEKVAGYLKLLQEEGIPVLWRPLHEAAGNYTLYGSNGAWFWWGRGGAEPCKKLWKLLRDKLEGEYGLDNLIWVWTLDATRGAEKDYASWYPGNDLVDVVGVDIYADDTEAKSRQYQAAVDLSGGRKLVAVSECGNIPDPGKCFADGETWNWFLTWDLESYPLNTESYWKSLMNSPRVLTRETMPSLK